MNQALINAAIMFSPVIVMGIALIVEEVYKGLTKR